MSAVVVAPVDHTTPVQWLWVVLPVLALVAGAVWAWAAADAGGGRGARHHVERVAGSLRRVSGLPAWCAGGALVATWAMGVAVVGFLWDVAWHIDLGRDQQLFTVPHVLILMGLLGVGVAAVVSVGLATVVGDAPAAWRFGPLHVPRAALALGVLSAGAATGFPLDDLWHANYGVDVTMWGPTHLLMIGGASLSPIAIWLLIAEAGPVASRSWLRYHLLRIAVGATLIGLSTFQLEFDDGVPQWQALYQPVLIALAASVAMVAARVAFGRGRALLVAANFLAVRGLLALLVGPGLGHVVPRFPLYLGIAVCVEGAALLAERRRLDTLRTALLCGLAAGTLGLATEWGFSHVWGRHPWQPSLLPGIWAAVAVAVAGAVVGAAMGRVLSFRRAGVPRTVLVAAGAVVLVCLAVPLPRNVAPVTAVLRTQAAGAAVPTVDRDGLASFEQPFSVELTTTPADAGRGADWFEVLSWQGGGERNTPLVETSPGVYRSVAPVPTGGSWKSLVVLARRDVIMATPVSFPRDAEYGQPAIPAVPQRTVTLQAASHYLLREAHGGAIWPMVLAYTGLLGVTLTWVGVLVAAFVATERRWEGPGGGAPRPAVGRERVGAHPAAERTPAVAG